MLKPSDLTTAIVTKWRLIAALVRLLGDDDNIYAYQPAATTETNLRDAVARMPYGSVMVAWERTTVRSQWEHAMCAYIRPSATASCEAILDLLIDGVATGDPQRAYDMRLHSSCDPMTLTSVEPFGLEVHANAIIELVKFSFILPEIGG